MVQLRTLAPPTGKLPNGYDVNAKCDFHSGAPGHTIENCRAFKHVVQDLVDSKAINFAPTPNVIQNPMPAHGGASANAIDGDEGLCLVSDVNAVKTPLLFVKDRLLKGGVFPGCMEDCQECPDHVNGCANLREGIQKLMNEGGLQFD